MLYFFRRGDATISCETRLSPDGPGYHLVITENDVLHVEQFDVLPKLLAREHELLLAWRAQGWRDVGRPTRAPVDSWPGPR
jgi:hypothetical protein